tara:strand:- start:87 stop:599 length:513 start_codon:yes stop_codon:yes gene_type:complete
MNIEIIDDFLPSYYNDSYMKIFSGYNGNNYTWYFANNLNNKEYRGNFYFSNLTYDSEVGVNCTKQLLQYEPLLNRLNLTMSKVKRIKSNLYLWTGRRIHHQTHTDYEPNLGLRTCLYYVNDSDRVTVFDGKKRVRCRNNRAIIFDGSIRHHSTTPTNVNHACSINIDFWL